MKLFYWANDRMSKKESALDTKRDTGTGMYQIMGTVKIAFALSVSSSTNGVAIRRMPYVKDADQLR